MTGTVIELDSDGGIKLLPCMGKKGDLLDLCLDMQEYMRCLRKRKMVAAGGGDNLNFNKMEGASFKGNSQLE
jgi:hypothetical protein